MTAAADWIARRKALADAATPGEWWHTFVADEDRGIVWHATPTGPDSHANTDGDLSKADAEWIADARTSLPQAVAALDAVLRLHATVHDGSCSDPEHCTPVNADGFICGECYEDPPCATVRAITDHLGAS